MMKIKERIHWIEVEIASLEKRIARGSVAIDELERCLKWNRRELRAYGVEAPTSEHNQPSSE